MKALIRNRAETGLWKTDVPKPEPDINDVLIGEHQTASVAHGSAYLRMGQVGAKASALKRIRPFWVAELPKQIS
jgi:hypothetical protein